MIDWTVERIASLSPEKIKSLRENAIRMKNEAVIELCDGALDKLKPVRIAAPRPKGASISRRGQVVIGYHFICPLETGVTLNGDGTAWTGTWVVEKGNAEKSTKINAYVALHTEKSELSYFQGKIKDWRRAKRDREYADGRPVKIAFGVDFLLDLTNESLQWSGDGSGEKGYVWREVS